MVKIEYLREKKEDKPVIAICYDFDKTLSPTDMQAQGYIQSIGYDVGEFWHKSNSLAANNEMDQNLSYMYVMKQEAEGKVLFTREKLTEYGSKVELFPGVSEWFKRINEYGKEKGVIVEHYIISSGLKEMIEGTEIAKNGVFKKIYASSFFYNENGVAVWPSQVINYTNKTQFLYRIKKGTLDINDPAVNDYFSPEEERVPFTNMIYIGDSDTDIPCMKLINTYGGYSIGVYDEDTKEKAKVYKMMKDKRIKYFAAANYSENTELDILVKSIIDNTVFKDKLEKIHYQCKDEFINHFKLNDQKSQEKVDLIISLSDSGNFTRTHTVVKEMSKIKDWSELEKEEIFSIGLKNTQVRYILTDVDISLFYKNLLKNLNKPTINSKKIAKLLEEA